MPDNKESPNHAKAPQPRWFGHPSLLLGLFTLVAIDLVSMQENALPKWFLNTGRTGPTIFVFGEIHEVDGVLECRWRGEPGWSDANTSLHLVGTTPVFMNIPNGVLHTTSMSGYCMPTWSLEGLDERTIALLVYESALQSQAEGARGFCQLNPEAMAMLGRGALPYEEMRPIGYLRNAILLSLLSLFAFCTVRGRADLWLERVTKAIGPPQRDPKACPACGSDIHGLDKCPECGREI